MRLPAATGQRLLRQSPSTISRAISTARDSNACAPSRNSRLVCAGIVPLHVLRAPSSRMGDERELRKLAADLGEKRHQLARDGLYIVLSAHNDKRRDFILQEVRFAIVSWF